MRSFGQRLALSLLGGVAAYVTGAFAGGWLVSVLSTNTHDRDLEAAMTGAFVIGPLAAVAGFVATFLLLQRRGRRA
jgi:hypothetical protein